MSVRFYRDGKLLSEVDCFRGLNLLGHAQIEETETGSECGGHGKCGKDRVLVVAADLDKLNPPNGIEKKFFTGAELESGWRLACQAFPNEDGMDIEVVVK